MVTLVCGPPCAGKTTYVQLHAKPGDTVLDQDQIAQDLGSGQQWLHSRATSMRAHRHRHMRQAILTVADSTDGTAWVIRCEPDGHKRRYLAAKLRATRVIVLKPPIVVALDRAQARPDPRKTRQLVTNWYLDFTPADCDTTLEGFPLGRPG